MVSITSSSGRDRKSEFDCGASRIVVAMVVVENEISQLGGGKWCVEELDAYHEIIGHAGEGL